MPNASVSRQSFAVSSCGRESHEELREELERLRGCAIAAGVYPPWLEDNEDVISAIALPGRFWETGITVQPVREGRGKKARERQRAIGARLAKCARDSPDKGCGHRPVFVSTPHLIWASPALGFYREARFERPRNK